LHFAFCISREAGIGLLANDCRRLTVSRASQKGPRL
jgi:hypothetical protein